MKLTVGNVPSTVTDADLKAAFDQFGSCDVHLEGAQACVVYHDPAHAEAACSQLHQSSLCGAQITVQVVTETPLKPSRSRSRSRSPPKASTDSPRKEHEPRSPANQPGETVPPVTDSSEPGHSPAKLDVCAPHQAEPGKPEEPKVQPPVEVPAVASQEDTPGEPAAASAPENKAEAMVMDSPEEAQPPVSTEEVKVSEEGKDTDSAPQPMPTDAAPAEAAQQAKQKVGDEVCAEDGSCFKVEKVNAKNDDLSQWKCLACNKTLQKKSVKTHVATKTHKQHLSK